LPSAGSAEKAVPPKCSCLHERGGGALSDPDTALDTLARDEMGIDPDELGGSARYSSPAIFRGSLPVRNSDPWINHGYTFSRSTGTEHQKR